MNFATQSELWLSNLGTRKRRPAKPSTLSTFNSYVKHHITPIIGDHEIVTFGNAKMRNFVAHLASEKLAPKTIAEIANAVKQIIASAIDPQTGDPLYPRTWNSEFIDAPIVENQHQPIVGREQIEKAIANASKTDATLYMLLAASGLRIGEALSLRIGTAPSSSYFADGAITVQSSLWRRREQTPKTIAALRTVEIAGPAVERIAQFAKGRTGFLFGNGVPPSQSAFRDRLNKAGIEGFHALRRFRVTHLRKQRAPEDLIRYWLGHSNESVTDGYSKLKDDAVERRRVCEQVGAGFSL
jgi:integrase